jgi:hypothetical protein
MSPEIRKVTPCHKIPKFPKSSATETALGAYCPVIARKIQKFPAATTPQNCSGNFPETGISRLPHSDRAIRTSRIPKIRDVPLSSQHYQESRNTEGKQDMPSLTLPYAITGHGAVVKQPPAHVHIPAGIREILRQTAGYFAARRLAGDSDTLLKMEFPTAGAAATFRAQAKTYADEKNLAISFPEFVPGHWTRVHPCKSGTIITEAGDRVSVPDISGNSGRVIPRTWIEMNKVPAHWNKGTDVRFRMYPRELDAAHFVARIGELARITAGPHAGECGEILRFTEDFGHAYLRDDNGIVVRVHVRNLDYPPN